MINFTGLNNLSRLKKYPQGAVIAADGEAAELVVILKGEVGVFTNYGKKNQAMTAKIGPGDFFGETALLLGKSPPCTYAALEDIIALPLGKSNAVSFIRNDPEVALELMKALCEKMDAVCADYEKLAGRPWQQAEPTLPMLTPRPPAPSAAEVKKAWVPAPPPKDTALKVAAPKVTAPKAAVLRSQAPAAPVAAPAKVPTNAPTTGFSLFPQGHGSYQLPLENEEPGRLMDRTYSCPICKKEFKKIAVRSSKLMEAGTDSDMRHRYKGVEPLYFDVVTCPHCLFSALSDMFASPDLVKAVVPELKTLKLETEGMFEKRDATAVFAGYYLALLCAPKFYASHQLATAKLLLKLMRVYQDCGDMQMEQVAAQRALDAYMYVYLNEHSDEAQDQQICIILGELYLKLNDLKNAREFFFKAKTNRSGVPILKNHAETRISDIREIENKG